MDGFFNEDAQRIVRQQSAPTILNNNSENERETEKDVEVEEEEIATTDTDTINQSTSNEYEVVESGDDFDIIGAAYNVNEICGEREKYNSWEIAFKAYQLQEDKFENENKKKPSLDELKDNKKYREHKQLKQKKYIDKLLLLGKQTSKLQPTPTGEPSGTGQV